MASTIEPRPGHAVAGFRLERVLGRGGMSVVYIATDERLGRQIALKLLAPQLSEDERFRERFLRESRIAASLDHSGIVPIYDAGEADGHLYIAMRYVEGTSLKALLRDEGALDAARAVDLVAQIAGALDYAHARGLVHRDVKPANALIAREGGSEHVYLADFGLTKQATSQSGLTETGQFLGTADYTAPEQIERKPVDRRADVYSLGCVLYECLTGEPPFRSDSLMGVLWAHVSAPPPRPSEGRPDVPRALDEVVARAMAKAPADRFGTAQELAAAARAAMPAPLAAPAGGVRRRTIVAAAAVAVATVAVVAGGVTLVRGGDDAAARPTTAITGDGVQRIDPRTNRLVATIPLRGGVTSVAAGRDGAWALDAAGRRFARIDGRTNAVTVARSTSGVPVAIAATRDTVWVATRDGPVATAGLLVAADDGGRAPPRVVPVAVTQTRAGQQTFSDVAVERSAVWVTNPAGAALKRVRPRLGTLAATIPTGPSPPLFVTLGRDVAWVAASRRLVRIDPRTNTVTAHIPLSFTPRDAAADPSGVWLADGAHDAVVFVSATTNRVVRRIRVGRSPDAIAVGGGAVWTANRGDGSVSRIDPLTGHVTATVAVGGRPIGIAAAGDAVWVATHAFPPEPTAREYAAELGRTMERYVGHARDTVRGFMPGTPPDRFREGGTEDDRLMTAELVLLNRQLVHEVRALRPPASWRADHERLLDGLGTMDAKYRAVAAAAASTDVVRTARALSRSDDAWVTLRLSVSEAFRDLLPRTPLTYP
ncbi:MAG TPA: serine/threonine-protein kinase [Gaiellaceae bacterium]|nr:serine/threonine-protein kinase [Gaiellaceae bacterium]